MKQKFCCLLLVLTLSACGNKGDLYIPKSPETKSQSSQDKGTKPKSDQNKAQDDIS